MPSRVEIIEFCQKYSASCHHADGRVVITPVSLEQTGFNPVEATYEQLRGACVGLTYTLVFKGMNVFVSKDHVLFWDSVGKRLLDRPSLYFGEKRGIPLSYHLRSFQSLFITVIKTMTGEWALYQCRPLSRWGWPDQQVGYPASFGADPSHYLVYPLLEGTLKFLLSDHFTLDGRVVQEFKSKDGRQYKKGQYCSRVDHMLDLVMQTSSYSDLAQDLKLILDHIEFLYPGTTATSVISQEWRNPAMHGESNVPTAAGVVLNIALLFAMEKVKEHLAGSTT